MSEVKDMVDRFAPDAVHMQDDLFFADKQRARGFLDEYDKGGYEFGWFTLARANYFGEHYMSDAFMMRIKPTVTIFGFMT